MSVLLSDVLFLLLVHLDLAALPKHVCFFLPVYLNLAAHQKHIHLSLSDLFSISLP